MSLPFICVTKGALSSCVLISEYTLPACRHVGEMKKDVLFAFSNAVFKIIVSAIIDFPTYRFDLTTCVA